MIAGLSGVVARSEQHALVVMVSGVAYRVFTTPEAALGRGVGDEISLFTYLAVRENALELFGFLTEEELSFFELLIGIPGIGPRSALNVLSVAAPEMLRGAIREQNPAYLTKIAGIGPKLGQKIVNELKEKVGVMMTPGEGAYRDMELLDALCALGYSSAEARKAVAALGTHEGTTSDRVKEALKLLSRS